MPNDGSKANRGRNSRDNRSGDNRPARRGRDDAGADRPRSKRPEDRLPDRDLAGPASWGRIARRGAGNMDYDDPDKVAKRPERPKPARDTKPEPRIPPPPDRDMPTAEDLQRSAAKAVRRGRSGAAHARSVLPPRPHSVKDPAVALKALVGEARAKSLNRRLREASKAFEAERFKDARGQLTPIVKEAPELPEGRELMGLAQYRLGQWKSAVDQLEAFRELSGSTEQHPVLADCYRALGRWADVDALWDELGSASPSADLVAEGRIVVAGAKADQGDLTSAIRILEQNWRPPKSPQGHHLRRAYALADLYDRAGRTPRARELFRWVQKHAPDLADVDARVKALG